MMYSTMDMETYARESARTASGKFHLTNDSEIMFLHAVLGIQSEIGEIMETFRDIDPEFINEDLDLVNLKEEIGDILFYLMMITREFDIPYLVDGTLPNSIDEENSIVDFLLTLNLYSSNLVDIAKKKCFYNKPVDIGEIIKSFNGICFSLNWIMGELLIDLEEVTAININKLMVRYPQKFTTEDAINRDIEAERVALENKPESMGMGYV